MLCSLGEALLDCILLQQPQIATFGSQASYVDQRSKETNPTNTLSTKFKTYKLWMCVNPAQCHDTVGNLSFKQLHFSIFCHTAHILFACLRWHNQSVNYQLSVFFNSSKNGTRFKLLSSVIVGGFQKFSYDFKGTQDSFQTGLVARLLLQLYGDGWQILRRRGSRLLSIVVRYSWIRYILLRHLNVKACHIWIRNVFLLLAIQILWILWGEYLRKIRI